MTDPLIPILRQVADELARREAPGEPVPLTVGELPERKPWLPCIWLDRDGRPTPALGYRFDVEVAARNAYDVSRVLGGLDPAVLYPESAAPALWARFLARQAGRVG